MKHPYLYVCILLLFTSDLQAQKNLQVLDWKGDAMLNSYLVQRMHEQYKKRSETEFPKALSSRIEALHYAARIRNNFSALVTVLKSTSAAYVYGTRIIRDGYHIERVVYETFSVHHVTGNLYVPEGKGPFPAVLFLCGHEDIAKATESYQKTAQLFVKHGFVVLIIDPISQSERYQIVDKEGNPLTRGGTTEHTLLNSADNLFGGSAAEDELWDNIYAVNLLTNLKEVDSSRIGCVGNSGGGMQVIYLAAADPRIKVLAPCSYLATRDRTMELSGPADGCAQIPGEGAYHLEMADYLMAAAPRPLLILAGRYDFIDYTGTQQAYGELKRFYKTLGAQDRVSLFTYDDGHGISKPKREAAVRWFRKWLCNDDRPVYEGSLTVSTPAELEVVKTGRIATAVTPYQTSIPDRNLALFDATSEKRTLFLKLPKQQILDTIRSMLDMNATARIIETEHVGVVSKDSLSYEKLIFRRGGEPPVPALLLMPESPAKGLVIVLPDKGKALFTDSVVALREYLSQGKAVLLADLRGFGETEDRAIYNDPKYYNREYRNDMLALHIGSNIVGQRVIDIETILKAVDFDKRLRTLPVEIRASGLAALPALHAAVLFPQVNQWHLDLPILSYREILSHPSGKDWYSFVIPRVLQYYDLPDLINLAGKEKLDIIRTVPIAAAELILEKRW